MVTVEIKGVPTVFPSILEKEDFLLGLYADLLDLAIELQVNQIEFITHKLLH